MKSLSSLPTDNASQRTGLCGSCQQGTHECSRKIHLAGRWTSVLKVCDVVDQVELTLILMFWTRQTRCWFDAYDRNGTNCFE